METMDVELLKQAKFRHFTKKVDGLDSLTDYGLFHLVVFSRLESRFIKRGPLSFH